MIKEMGSMQFKTPLTRKKLSDHLTYHGWKYIILVAGAILGWNLIYAQTAYRVPQEKRIDVYIKCATTSQAVADAFLEKVWKEIVPEMELVSSTLMAATNDYSSEMQMSVWIAAGEGDIYILPSADFKSYASAGAFLNLQAFVDDGTLPVEGVDLSAGKVCMAVGSDAQGNTVYDEELQLFGIPLDSYYGYMEGMSLDNRGMVMCVLTANRNDANVLPFMGALLRAGEGEPPSWLLENGAGQ